MNSIFVCLILICTSMIAIAQQDATTTDTVPTAQQQQSTQTPAQDIPPGTAPETLPSTTPQASPQSSQTAPQTSPLPVRPVYTANAHLSPLSTWLPLKWGLSFGYIASERWTLEAEWTHKSLSTSVIGIDAAEVVDQRLGAQARWFPAGGSSNLIFGLFKSQFSFQLGNSYLQNISGTPASTSWKVESIGPQIGVSNRWQWSNGLTLGADWFVAYIPLFSQVTDDGAIHSISNSQDRSDIDRATKVIESIPQFDVLRLTLGYTF